jgi:hypothetical protein
MLAIFLQAQTDQPPDFTSSVSPLPVVPGAISKLCEILSERAFELFGELVAVNDLSPCITYALSPFAEGPFGFCLTLMKDSIPYVFVELTSLRPGNRCLCARKNRSNTFFPLTWRFGGILYFGGTLGIFRNLASSGGNVVGSPSLYD